MIGDAKTAFAKSTGRAEAELASDSAPKSILITGASSGLGAALAEAYAFPGVALHLGGRDLARLAATAEKCRARGAEVSIETADIRDQDRMRRWIETADDRSPLDLVIANAGIGGGATVAGEAQQKDDVVRAIAETNFLGTLNTVLPIMPRMILRRRGQIVLIASVAGWRGLPDAPAYSAAKAAVKVYGEALRVQLAPAGVKVNVVLPGLVDTPMSRGLPTLRPFLSCPETSARYIRRCLERNVGRIGFAWPLTMIMWLLAVLPAAWTDQVLARIRLRSTAAKPS